MTITGGKYSYTKVTTYQMNGEAQDLPDLITGRGYHACGHFMNSDGDIVGVDMSFYSTVVNEKFAGLYCLRGFYWQLED